jgi:hypothetical protein
MKKLSIATALLFAALPFTFDGVTPTVSKAHARIGRPLTPFSFAGAHRRAVRRTFGVGANLGYRGFYHPVARAAVAGAALSTATYGAGYYGAGYGGGYGYGAPLYDYAGAAPDDYAAADDFAGAAPGWGGGWGGWGWNSPWRPLYGAAIGWGGGWGGWGWNRPWRRWW